MTEPPTVPSTSQHPDAQSSIAQSHDAQPSGRPEMIATIEDMQLIAKQIRRRVMELSYQAKTPHLGSSLSCVEMIVAAYWGTKNPPSPLPDQGGSRLLHPKQGTCRDKRYTPPWHSRAFSPRPGCNRMPSPVARWVSIPAQALRESSRPRGHSDTVFQSRSAWHLRHESRAASIGPAS